MGLGMQQTAEQWRIFYAKELYKAALPERDEDPLLWAMVLSKMGDASEMIGERVRARDLIQAASNEYRAALTVFQSSSASKSAAENTEEKLNHSQQVLQRWSQTPR